MSAHALGVLDYTMPNVNDSGIYIIRNAVTGDFYIGSSARLHAREINHFGELKRGTHGNKRMLRSYAKHGRDAFSFEVIALVSPSDLIATEERLLARLVDHPKCYNMKRDAHGGRRGFPHSPETRAKIGAAHRGKPKAPEHVAKMAASKRGKPIAMTPEGMAKRAEGARRAWIGRKHSTDAIEKMRARQRQKTPAQLASVARVSLGNIGRTHTVSPEARARMSAAKKGMTWPAEVIEKRNAAIRAAYARKRALVEG